MGVRTGDLNGDGLPDLVLVNRGAGQVQAHLSRAVAFAQEFGSGCSGSAGTPEAGHTALAILGQRATIVLRAARPLSACVLGISTGVVHDVIASTSNGDVTIYLAGPVLAFSLVTDGQGGRKFSFDVPITPQLGGEDLYFQWLVFDPQGAFQQTVATSSALGMRIGY